MVDFQTKTNFYDVLTRIDAKDKQQGWLVYCGCMN